MSGPPGPRGRQGWHLGEHAACEVSGLACDLPICSYLGKNIWQWQSSMAGKEVDQRQMRPGHSAGAWTGKMQRCLLGWRVHDVMQYAGMHWYLSFDWTRCPPQGWLAGCSRHPHCTTAQSHLSQPLVWARVQTEPGCQHLVICWVQMKTRSSLGP